MIHANTHLHAQGILQNICSWMFALLACVRSTASPGMMVSLECVEKACMRQSGDTCVDVVRVAVRAVRERGPAGTGTGAAKRGSRRGSSKGPVLPELDWLSSCTWDTDRKGSNCHVSEGARVVEIRGEGTAVVAGGVRQGRLCVCIFVEKIDSKDVFLGVVESGATRGKEGRYLPEIGYGLRGGTDKGRLKSLPQYSGGRGAVLDTGVFIRNFQQAQVSTPQTRLPLTCS